MSEPIDLAAWKAENDERRARRDTATSGPWGFRHRCVGHDVPPRPGRDESCGLGWDWDEDAPFVVPPEPMRGVFALGADAAFVAASRTDQAPERIDALIAVIEQKDAALRHAKMFIEYARYELEPGPAIPGTQFPTQVCADKEMAAIDTALALTAREKGGA